MASLKLLRPALAPAWAGGWRVPLTAWAISRGLVLLVGIVAGIALGAPPREIAGSVPDPLNLLAAWDTTWYLQIASDGYAQASGAVGVDFTNLAFFPLLPGVMAAFLAIGANAAVGAVIVSNLAFLGGLFAFHALTASRFGARSASQATWVLALLPPAVYASLAYTEGIAIACAVGAALLASRGRYLEAGLLAAVATATRPPGIVVAFLVVLLALRTEREGRPRRIAMALVPSLLVLVSFFAWMAIWRGSWLLPLDAQGAWGRGGAGTGVFTTAPTQLGFVWDYVTSGHFTAEWTSVIRDWIFIALYAWLVVRLWRAEGGIRSPWVLYSLAALAVPLSSGTTSSMARFGLLAFPLVWPLASWIEAQPRRRYWGATVGVVVIVALVLQLKIRAP